MVVAGAPTVNVYHALHISNMALDMKAVALDIQDPSSGSPIKTRIGKSTTSGDTYIRILLLMLHATVSLICLYTTSFIYNLMLTSMLQPCFLSSYFMHKYAYIFAYSTTSYF